MINFSIITICYNSESTIERTIKSVLDQSFTDYEYIIVDGASDDSTLDIIRKYEPLFEGRMQWKSEPDKGIYDAMNKGILRSKGTIIGIVNSDDWLESDALEIVHEYYMGNNKSLDSLYCGWIRFHYINGDTQIMKTSQKRLDKMAAQYRIDGVRHPAVFVPHKLYEKYGLFDDTMKVMADTDLLLRFYYKQVKFCFLNKILSNMSDGGVSNSSYNYFQKYLLSTNCDYGVILSKYNLNKIHYYYLLWKWKVKRILRVMVPDTFIKLYRRGK